MTWIKRSKILIGLIFLSLLSVQTNALDISDDLIFKLKPGEKAPFEGVFMPESYYYFYEGSIAEKESCLKSISKLDTLCLNEPKLDWFSKTAKPYVLGAVTGAAVVAVLKAERDSEKIALISGVLILNLMFAF